MAFAQPNRSLTSNSPKAVIGSSKRTKRTILGEDIMSGYEGGKTTLPPREQTPPEFTPVDFPAIDPASFSYTDPIKYAQEVGSINRGNIQKNWAQSRGMALEALDTELEGMKGYAEGASAFKRGQIALDNPFNQYQRTQQLRQVMPTLAGDLAGQRSRALAYAEGRLPDSMLDRSLELGARSNAADAASFAGFGSKSMQASKLSDLMSAEQRFQIGQYGEQLLGQNIQTEAALELAPTEYSQAGTEIKVMPEVGAGRLAYQGLSTINEATMLNPAAALTAKIGQEQFKTQIEQRTNEFNATGKYNASTFNSTGAYTAGLNAFSYDVAYEDAITAANQGELNNAIALRLAGINQNASMSGVESGQEAQATQGIVESMGALQGALNAASSVFTPTESQPAAKTQATTTTGTTTTGTTTPVSSGVDASIPTAVKFAGGMDVPQGYQKVATNPDGTYSAVPIQDYSRDLERFARTNRIPIESLDIKNAAIADRTVANSIGASYVPLPSFQPTGTLSSGKQVYSLPAAANSTNIAKGGANVSNIGTMLGALGVGGDAVQQELGALAGRVSNPEFLSQLDAIYAEKGAGAVSSAIQNNILGEKVDMKSDLGQQGVFMSQRVGELWGGLSPEQKSTALASMTGSAIASKTGMDVNNAIIPGTDRALAGGLRAGDAIALTANGKNGMALARNWNQISSIVTMATGEKNPSNIADIAHSIGALGYGPQGAAVPVEPKYMAKMGARPAPELGVGAVAFDKESYIPKHYSKLTNTPDGKVVAIPTNLMSTSTLGAGGSNVISFNKSKEIAAGRHPAMKMWSKGTGAIRGAAGGSALVSSMHKMVKNNPNMAGAIMAQALFNNVLGK